MTAGSRQRRERVITPELVAHLRKNFRLDWKGDHGVAHWARVRVNGLDLARLTGADTRVVELFAFLHDFRRKGEYRDPKHGPRAAESIDGLQGRYFDLTPEQLEQLRFACMHHTGGTAADTDDITVLTCWDADRLDLGRVGIVPAPHRLNTPAARAPRMIERALQRSRAWLQRRAGGGYRDLVQ